MCIYPDDIHGQDNCTVGVSVGVFKQVWRYHASLDKWFMIKDVSEKFIDRRRLQ